MKNAVLIFMLTIVFHYFGVEVGVAQSVMASFDDPRCEGETVCPTTPLLFTCTVTGSMASLASVRLPSGEVVNIRSDDTTAVEEGGTLPDGVVVQSHSARIEDGLANYMLALTIESASILNGNNVTCDDRTLDPTTANASCHVSTDTPGPPVDPSQIVSANTQNSTEIRWQHPEETGGSGIYISNYTVTVSNDSHPVVYERTVIDDARDNGTFTHTISGLDYNTTYSVGVTAINSCGFAGELASTPAFIKARVPPRLSDVSVEFSCDVTLEEPIPVTVNWMYGSREVGVVYPGEQSFSLVLSPTNYPCVRETATTCTAHIARDDILEITITQTNDISSTVDQLVLDARVLTVERQVLSLETQQFNITVRRNSECPETSSPVLVTFGARPANGGECVGQQNATATPIPPGATASFFVDADSISLGPGEALCYVVSLNGVTVVSGDSGVSVSGGGCGEQRGLSATAAAGIALAVALLATLPVGVALGCGGMWFLMRSRGKRALHGNQEKREKQKEMVELYDDPDRMKTEFSVSNNQAYGQIGTTAQ